MKWTYFLAGVYDGHSDFMKTEEATEMNNSE